MNNYHDQAARLRDEILDSIKAAVIKTVVVLTIGFVAVMLVVIAVR